MKSLFRGHMTKRILTAIILLVGLLTASCTAKELNDSTMADGLVTTIPFKLHGSMILVELVVDGSDPLAFIFDTGAGGTVISARTADRLGIIAKETVSRQDAAGDAPIGRSEKHTIRIGDLTMTNTTLGIAELDHIDRRLGMRIDGVIGWPILSQYAVRPNYDTMQYEFVSIPANIAFAEAGALSWPEVMGILGNEILMRFNMFIDLQQKRIFLEPNLLFHAAFEVNCSGLELVYG
jgi:hypothetical protein